MKLSSFVLCLLIHGFWVQFCFGNKHFINVGLLVDIGTWEGKIIACFAKKAVSDLYDPNSQNQTRIVLHLRDLKGDSFHSVATALDLLENIKVHALIVPKIDNKDSFLVRLADKAKVPVLSFHSISWADAHPYFLQVGEDEATEFHGLSALIKTFKWRNCAIMYDDTADAVQIQRNLNDILLTNSMDAVYQTAISVEATDDQLVHELSRLVEMKASVVLVHLSSPLAFRVFKKAKVLGMMTRGYAWIITSKTMNVLEYQSTSIYESMQGVLGLKSHVSESGTLRNFSLRCRSEFHPTECNSERRELHMYGVWAYDAVGALAQAIERTRTIKQSGLEAQCNLLDPSCLWVSESGPAFLSQISSNKFVGLAGPFRLMNRKIIREAYQIMNIIGKGERRVGFWTSSLGLTKDIYLSNHSSNYSSLETIIWPGISTNIPTSLSLHQISGQVLRVVVPGNSSWPQLVNWHYDPQTTATTVDGFCLEVFRAALDWLHLDISTEFIPFSNGSYNDLIYQVFLQNYDAAVGDITIVANRSEYVDFTLSYTDLGVGVVAKLDQKDPWFFLRPLDRDLWITSACLFVLTGSVVWFIEHPINEEFQGSPTQQVGTLLWFAFSSLVYAHRESLKSNISKFVVGIWLFVVLILTSSYTANLSSLLTIQQFKLRKSDYVGYSAGSFVPLVASNLNFGDSNKRLYQLPEEYDEALRRGSRNGGVSAILDEIPYLKILLAKYPLEYTLIETSMTTDGFGFVFPKGSFLAREVSRAISGLRGAGKLSELEKKWFSSESQSFGSISSRTPTAKTLGTYNFSGLFLVNGISQAIAILIFLILMLRPRLNCIYSEIRMWTIRRLTNMINHFPHGNTIEG